MNRTPLRILAPVKEDLLPMNRAQFEKMAHGDIAGLVSLANEYFSETRRLMPGWAALAESANHVQLHEELHRCKGGASLFGLERMVALLGRYESSSHIETHGFDITTFETELAAAEREVAAMGESGSR